MHTEQVGKRLSHSQSGGFRGFEERQVFKSTGSDKVRVEKVNKNFLGDTRMVHPKPRDLIISAKDRGRYTHTLL